MSRLQIRGRLTLPVRGMRGLAKQGRFPSPQKKIWCACHLSFLAPLLGFGGSVANGYEAKMRIVQGVTALL